MEKKAKLGSRDERTEMKGGQGAPVGGPSIDKSKSEKSSRAAPSSADLYWTCTGLVLDLYCAQVPRALRALGEGAPSASQGSARAQGAPGWLKAVRHRAPNSQIKKGPKKLILPRAFMLREACRCAPFCSEPRRAAACCSCLFRSNEANAAGDHARREETGQRELQRSSSEASAREACFS